MEEEKRTEAEPKKEISRREALKRIAKVGIGVAGVSALASCDFIYDWIYYDYYDYYSAYSDYYSAYSDYYSAYSNYYNYSDYYSNYYNYSDYYSAYSNYYAYAG